MSDVLMGVTEVAAVQQTVISSIVQEALIQEAVVFPTVQQYIIPQGAKQVDIPRSGNPSVSTKTENTEISAQTLTYAADSLPADQYKAVQYLVEDIAVLQANIPLMEDMLMKAAKVLAEDMDTYVYGQLKLASASGPDHRIAYAGSTLAQTDILEGLRLLRVQSVPKSDLTLLVEHASEKAMLLIGDFVRADQYGNNGGLANGELGRIYGCRVIASNVVDADENVIYHKSACAFARQLAPKYETQRDLANLSDRLSISHIYGAKVLDSGKRCVKIGTAS